MSSVDLGKHLSGSKKLDFIVVTALYLDMIDEILGKPSLHSSIAIITIWIAWPHAS
jgi:hypothetical protein